MRYFKDACGDFGERVRIGLGCRSLQEPFEFVSAFHLLNAIRLGTTGM